MQAWKTRLLAIGVAAMVGAGIYAATGSARKEDRAANDPVNGSVSASVTKAVNWLVSVQGKDGGWGQDGGETSYVRQGEHLESKGNDVANTAVAVSALLHSGNTPTSGPYRRQLARAVQFILEQVEHSPNEGLAVTDQTNTQIQRKLGPYIDTFLTSKLLAELDGNMGDQQVNARVRRGLERCVAKIEKNQLKDGSWNIAGGWAPILGTSLASQSLYAARAKGVSVDQMAMAKVQDYTKRTAGAGTAAGTGAGGGLGRGGSAGYAGGVAGGVSSAVMVEASAASAGVSLYKSAQELEQLSRTGKDRELNAPRIAAIKGQLSDARFVTGFGSIGGEEFFSYLNISDSLHRTGGPEWEKWNADIKSKILKLQNEDGTWAGHHCITGRVAVTGAAILTLLADRDPIAVQPASFSKRK